jgi:fluoride exporter
MKQILIVGLGGCLGVIARYKLGGLLLHHTADWRFPLSTFAVNVLGCFLAGLAAGLVEHHGYFSSDARILIFSGILGGFTTFSAFGLDAVFLIRRDEALIAFGYVMLSVVCGAAALWLGILATLPRTT